jgi:hypothetical protein
MRTEQAGFDAALTLDEDQDLGQIGLTFAHARNHDG